MDSQESPPKLSTPLLPGVTSTRGGSKRSLRLVVSDTDVADTALSQASMPDFVHEDTSPLALPARSQSDSNLLELYERWVAQEMDQRYRLLAKGHLCDQSEDLLSPSSLREASVAGVSSEVATVLVILKAFVGGTMLVLPASLLQTGIVAGNITLWAVAALELMGMLKLLEAHQRFGGSFGQLAQRALGSGGSWAVEASIVLSQLGFTAAEMIYVAKSGSFVLGQLSAYMPDDSWLGHASTEHLEHRLIWCQLLLAIPVSWYRDLSALTIFNVMGNLMVFGALVVLSFVTGRGLAEQGADQVQFVPWSSPLPQVVTFAGFSVFAFEGITMVIPIYLAHKNKANFRRTLSWTIVGITILFSVFASANVVLYGEVLKPIVTLNLPESSDLRVWVSCAFALGSLTLVFLMAFPTYEILDGWRLFSRCSGTRILRTLVVTCCALLARFGGAQLDLFISVVGAVGCVPLAFVYPAAIHFFLAAETILEKATDLLLFLFGSCVMLNCLLQLVA
mmetsp:Transcript_27020/g.58826  ORF Transcript_27020/g.58826 Transcript_27020/m.58826 type:complete len:507 (-) Transcript_27020:210-1730(-)